MKVIYCDLCGTPLKEGTSWVLYISSPTDGVYNGEESYNTYLGRIEKGCKELCPTCKYVFDKMFELRLTKLSQLAEELEKIYKIPTIKNPKDRKNDKEKK